MPTTPSMTSLSGSTGSPSSTPTLSSSRNRNKKRASGQWDEKGSHVTAAEHARLRQVQAERAFEQQMDMKERFLPFMSPSCIPFRTALMRLMNDYQTGDLNLRLFLVKLKVLCQEESGQMDLFDFIVRQFLDGTNDSKMSSYLIEHGVSGNVLGVAPLTPLQYKSAPKKRAEGASGKKEGYDEEGEEGAGSVMVSDMPQSSSPMLHNHRNSMSAMSPSIFSASAGSFADARQPDTSSSSTLNTPTLARLHLSHKSDLEPLDEEDPLGDDLADEYGDDSDMACPDMDEQGKRKSRKKQSISKGIRSPPNKWTKSESQQLIVLVSQFGERQWKKIAEQLGGGKTGAQCAQHWKRVLSPEIRKGSWDDKEEEMLFHLVAKHGQSWKNVASEIKTRTDIQCRYQYFKANLSREVHWTPQEEDVLLKKIQQIVADHPLTPPGMDGLPLLPPIPWVEVTRYMQRMKMTKIPRTALECKQRYCGLPPSRQSLVLKPLSGSAGPDPSAPSAFQQQMFMLPMQQTIYPPPHASGLQQYQFRFQQGYAYPESKLADPCHTGISPDRDMSSQ